MSALQRELLKRGVGSLPPRPPGQGSRFGKRPQKDYSPLPWNGFFDSVRDLLIPETGDMFRVYLAGFENNEVSNKPLLMLLHGGGYCGLTWALFSKALSDLVHCKIAALDLRGHGDTITGNEEDLSVTRLAQDVGHVFKALHEEDADNEDLDLPPVVLVGHSMGGAVAVHCAARMQELIPTMVGLIVIDVVEGTALDALQGMQSLLRSRPHSFPSLENAIEYGVRSGQTRNVEAARISIPGQLKNRQTSRTGTFDVTSSNTSAENAGKGSDAPYIQSFSPNDEIKEEDEDNEDIADHSVEEQALRLDEQGFKLPSEVEGYVWRINLAKTEPYWKGWFEGLSNLFLDAPVPAKLLLLAGIDRLDKTLTVGQMQGKFQMQVLPQCGHAVHEDVPEKVAEAVATFLVRNRFTVAKAGFEQTFPC